MSNNRRGREEVAAGIGAVIDSFGSVQQDSIVYDKLRKKGIVWGNGRNDLAVDSSEKVRSSR